MKLTKALLIFTAVLMLIGAMSCSNKDFDATPYRTVADSLLHEQMGLFLFCAVNLNSPCVTIEQYDSAKKRLENISAAWQKNDKEWEQAIHDFYH